MMFSKKIRECVEGANNNASIRLHANENPLGSPDIIQTGQYDLSLLSLYPDPTYNALRAAIGERWNINPEQIITGNGSDELIDITLRSLLKPGARLTAPRHSFMMYKKRTDILGALYSEIPVKSGRILPEDLKEAVSHKPDILVLVNPSNPLGHYIAPSEMISLVETIPPETTIIIDEAYAEFTPDIENTAGIQIVHKRVNSICLRTFSKRMDLPDCVLAGLTSAQICIHNWKLAGRLTMSVLYLLLLVNMHYRIVSIFSKQQNIVLAGEENW
ncbi:aminotransferase class I/II-fold pyridoxal phosphate-dependent enzyme [Enterobacter hormaechei]